MTLTPLEQKQLDQARRRIARLRRRIDGRLRAAAGAPVSLATWGVRQKNFWPLAAACAALFGAWMTARKPRATLLAVWRLASRCCTTDSTRAEAAKDAV